MTILTPAQVQEIEDNFDSKRVRTHWKDCWKCHPDCAIARLIASHRALEEKVDAAEETNRIVAWAITEREQQLQTVTADLDMRRDLYKIQAEQLANAEAEATRLREALEAARICLMKWKHLCGIDVDEALDTSNQALTHKDGAA